ncbi:hypothetical protein FRB91_008593 [Serendipita sp. 411]|nr:hypothetical protein FRC15_006916 [Serendipita sp. 397]KAG8770228.1 hypothetical protein FRC16_006413 [Serendipita sp. 398]KAG8837750.1 hypothetical protein FRC20_006613 [Serendipita sp. 405]KAG8859226.1 hypothetical protein FRB91_008593 [Serendipita sp. 411]
MQALPITSSFPSSLVSEPRYSSNGKERRSGSSAPLAMATNPSRAMKQRAEMTGINLSSKKTSSTDGCQCARLQPLLACQENTTGIELMLCVCHVNLGAGVKSSAPNSPQHLQIPEPEPDW